jgi:hypothetical protein
MGLAELTLFTMGDPDAEDSARTRFSSALRVLGAEENPAERAAILWGLARLEAAANSPDEAALYAKKAIELFEKVGDVVALQTSQLALSHWGSPIV